MASAFGGYLMMAGGQKFPDKYIEAASYKATPNQREEIKAYRDENTRDLTRVTAEGHKSKIVFNTRPGLHLKEKMEFVGWFTSHENDSLQRRITITFWNDETNSYATGDFYRPDMQFTIKKITEDDIIYDKLSVTLVEY